MYRLFGRRRSKTHRSKPRKLGKLEPVKVQDNIPVNVCPHCNSVLNGITVSHHSCPTCDYYSQQLLVQGKTMVAARNGELAFGMVGALMDMVAGNKRPTYQRQLGKMGSLYGILSSITQK